MTHDPILITGCARSGTSMVAGIFDTCGAFGGKLAGPNPWNRKGMFENTEIRNDVVKPWLRSVGADPLGQDPLPSREMCERDRRLAISWRTAIEGVMRRHGYKEGPWFYKGAKMCLMWQVWDAAFPDARWIIVRRRDEGIVTSCLKTSFMRKRLGQEGWLAWIASHKERFAEMSEGVTNYAEVSSDEIVAGDLCGVRRLVAAGNLSWDVDAVEKFVDPGMFNSEKKHD